MSEIDNGPTVKSGKTSKSKNKKSLLGDLRKLKVLDSDQEMPIAPPLPTGGVVKQRSTVEPAKVFEKLAADQRKLQKDILAAAGETMAVSDFAGFRDPAERYKQAKAFAAALGEVDAIAKRHTAMRLVIEDGLKDAETLETNGVKLDADNAPADWKLLAQKRIQLWAGLQGNALPAGYALPAQPDWAKALVAQLKPFAQGKDEQENKNLREAVAKNAPTQADKQEAQRLGDELREASEKYQVRGADRSSVFFDAGRGGVTQSQEDINKGIAATAKLVELGCDILNSGGSYKQVQDLMASTGLPEEAWPPQLVQSVQAWRKTQRALVQERVHALFDKKKSGKSESPIERESLDAVMGIFNGSTELSEALEQIAEAAEKAKEAKEAAEKLKEGVESTTETVAKVGETAGKGAEATKELTATALANGIGSGVDGLLGLMQIVQGALEFYKAATEDEVPGRERALKLLGASLETLGGMARVAKDGLQMAKDFGGEHLAKQLEKVIPGLGIAVAAIELAKSTKELAESVDNLNKASALKRDALASFSRDDGDEAAVNVFANDKSGAKIQVGKNVVDTTANSLELGGAIGTTVGGHVGAATGAALSITAGVIKVGSKVVFAGIDWSAARKAADKIHEAQAGNYQAQVEVFEDSNFYAKMYLALMVKEENPMAKKYLVNNGIEEGDLDGPTSLGILRDAMLDKAKQSNDLEGEDTLFGKAMGLGGKLVDGVRDLTPEDVLKGAGTFILAGGLLAPVTLTIAEFGRKGLTADYDPKANYTVGGFSKTDASAWPKEWESIKATHIEHGLIDDATGLGAVLEKAATAAKGVADGVKFASDTAGRKALLEAIEATKAVRARAQAVQLQGYQPDSILPRKIAHRQAHQSARSLAVVADALIDVYWKRYDGLPANRPEWKALAIAAIDTALWTAFWKDGVENVGFPKDDAGVAAAIEKSLVARDAIGTAKDGKKKRQLALAYLDALDDVNEAALSALGIPEVNRRTPARTAIDNFMLLLNKERRRYDGYLADGKGTDQVLPPWKNPGKTFDNAMSSADYLAQWTKTWNYAKDEGFSAGTDDAGLTDALKIHQGFCDDANKAAGDPKAQLKAVRAMEVGAGRVKKHAIEFARKQRYAATPLKDYVVELRKTIVDETAEWVRVTNEEADQVVFNVTPAKQPAYLSSLDWRKVATEAVDKGAVLESKTATAKLAEALKSQKQQREAYLKEANDKKPNLKTMRKLAEAYMESLHTTAGAVAMTLGLKRYEDNKLMAGYLGKIMSAVEAIEKNTTLQTYRYGTKDVVDFKTAKLETGNWSDNKKKAIDNGVIPSEKSGIKEAIEALLKVAKSTDVGVKKEKREALVEHLKKVQATSRNAKWKTYTNDMIELAEAIK